MGEIFSRMHVYQVVTTALPRGDVLHGANSLQWPKAQQNQTLGSFFKCNFQRQLFNLLGRGSALYRPCCAYFEDEAV